MKHFLKNKKIILTKNIKNNVKISLVTDNLSDLNTGEVLIKSKYSTINFKDILVCRGNPGLVKRFPHTPGIDVSGIIIKSRSTKFKIGQKVIIIARPSGLSTPGGFQEFVKVKDIWVDALPKGISLKQAMILGTAGFTSMIIALKLKKIKNLLQKPILITGATSRVGMILIIILKSWGLSITACTRQPKLSKELRKLGAHKVIKLKDLINNNNMPLLKENFSIIVDNIGGEALQSSYRQLEKKGRVFLVGNSFGETTKLYILPFILRGLKIDGINAEILNNLERRKIFIELKKLCKNKKLNKIYEEKNLEYLVKKNIFKKNKKLKKILIKFK